MSNLDSMTFYGNQTLTEVLEKNVISFLNQGFLEVGAYLNVTKGKTNALGQDISAFAPINVTGITPNTLWRGIKNNWVWEPSGSINFKYSSGTPPIVPSGIYFNNTFVATGSTINGTGYYLDFSRGQVVFSGGVPSTSTVQVAHSLRAVSIYSTDSNEYRESITNWQIATAAASGSFNYKAYYPAIFVEVVSLKTLRGTEIGSRGKFINAQIQFEIFASNDYELKKIIDTLYMMETKFLQLYDVQNSPKPLNSRGELVNPTISYSSLLSTYPYGNARFDQDAITYKVKTQNLPIFRGRVRIGLNCDVVPI